jgi:hypothetical protein
MMMDQLSIICYNAADKRKSEGYDLEVLSIESTDPELAGKV